MIRQPPRSTLDRSSAASDVYKRQELADVGDPEALLEGLPQIGAQAVADRDAQRVVVLLRDLLRAQEAVSYTHLRAHETVLDLVCRLLLEKTQNHTEPEVS